MSTAIMTSQAGDAETATTTTSRSSRRPASTFALPVRALTLGLLASSLLLGASLGADPARASVDASSRSFGPAPGHVTATQASTPTLRASGTVDVDGLEMYYEVHGEGEPLLLLHGAYTGIDVTFGQLIPMLATDRMVIAVEQQAHGHTADIDRPLSYERMTDDTAAVLRQLEVRQADVFGYSMGANIALQLAVRHPDLVRTIAVASAYFDPAGLYAGVLDGIAATTPDVFDGSGLEEAYAAVAPEPADWPTLIEKVKELDLSFKGWAPESIASIEAPALVILGDSDIVDPAHAVRLFELLGGGVPGDFAGLPDARLAVLPGTTHIGLMAERTDRVAEVLREFLAAPVADDGR